MHPLIRSVLESGPVLTDGAWGTELQKLGLDPGEIADTWNLTHPERVEQVAQSYVDAGSRIILTNTFRANRIALASLGLAAKVSELNCAGVEISRKAAGNRAHVFASIGPSGKFLMAGEIGKDELRAAFAEQAKALALAGAEALVIETMADLAEANLALDAAKETGLPVIVCMVFDTGKHKDRTFTGVTPEQATRELTEHGADVVGANCGQDIESFVGVCKRLKAGTKLPVWIKPNAGLPELVGDRAVYNTTPEAFVDHVPALIVARANFIGGCCGTDPRFIRALAKLLHAPRHSTTAP